MALGFWSVKAGDSDPQAAPGDAVLTAWTSLGQARGELGSPPGTGRCTWHTPTAGIPADGVSCRASGSVVQRLDAQGTLDLKVPFVCKPGRRVETWSCKSISPSSSRPCWGLACAGGVAGD